MRTDAHHKNLIIALIKNTPPRSFWVLKISFIKKSVDHLQNERVQKKRYMQMDFLRKLKKYRLYFELLLLASSYYCGDNGDKMRTSFRRSFWDSKKAYCILLSVWVLFAFLEKGRPEKYCLLEVNLVFHM